jgi:uncharacterized protein
VKYFLLLIAAIAITLSGCKSTDEQIFEQLLPLAEQGDPIAQYNAGMFYNNGLGTSKNPQLAFEWFEKSASNNDPLGAYKVGCYYGGQGS